MSNYFILKNNKAPLKLKFWLKLRTDWNKSLCFHEINIKQKISVRFTLIVTISTSPHRRVGRGGAMGANVKNELKTLSRLPRNLLHSFIIANNLFVF